MTFKPGHEYNKDRKLTDQHKDKISKGLKEHYSNPENRERVSKRLKTYYKTHEHHRIGSKLTQEHRDMISKMNTDRIYTEERNNKVSESLRAFHKQKRFERRSKAHKKYYENHEVWNKGSKHSQKTKKRISEGMIRYWNEKKQEHKHVEWWDRSNDN